LFVWWNSHAPNIIGHEPMPGTIPPEAIINADAHEDIRPIRITHPLPRVGRNLSQFLSTTPWGRPPEAFDAG
jgi:hypothetical protein